MTLNLSTLIESSFRLFPEAPALIHGERRLTYRELRQRVGSFAFYLRELGLKQGDPVALLLPNRMSFTVAYFAALQAGGVVVPASYLSVGREVSYLLRDSGASLLIAWSGFERAAREGLSGAGPGRSLILVDESEGPLTVLEGPPPDPQPFLEAAPTRADDTAVILYTSGTTGEPKGAELTHWNMFSNAQYSSERLLGRPERPEFLGPGQVGLAALPLFHSFGQTCVQNACLLGGAALSYLERFEPAAAWETMARDAVTLFAGVPTMYFQLLRDGTGGRKAAKSLRHCVSGGAAMPVEVMREFDGRFSVNVLEGYGLSETSPVATFNVAYRPKKVGSIGLPILGVEVRVFGEEDRELPAGEVGELVVRGYNVMKGYHDRPEATREAMRGGWFHTGDLGRKDGDGYLFIVDRKKDMIIRGGFNVYPREVEEVLYSHPAVAEAAVVGVACPEYGEEVKAWLSLKAGAALSADEVTRFCRERLGAHKVPRLVEFLPSLPKGPTGKIVKRELRPRS
jgi:long-chain acyl-CoA synthetase